MLLGAHNVPEHLCGVSVYLGVPSTVGVERSDTADLPHEIRRRQTTSPTCLSVFTGCTSHSRLNIKSPYWRTKLYMGMRRDTWVLLFRSPIYQAVGHCVLPAPVACRCPLSDSPPSVAGPSRLPVHESGTLCHRRRRQPSRCLCSVSVWSRTSSDNPIQTSSSDVLTVRLFMLTV